MLPTSNSSSGLLLHADNSTSSNTTPNSPENERGIHHQEKAKKMLQFLSPRSLPYTDLQGRTLKLWKYKTTFFASLKKEGHPFILIPGRNIHNALVPKETDTALLSHLEEMELKKWHLAYIEEKNEIYVWPFLFAAGKDGEKSQFQRKIDDRKEHFTDKDLKAAWREKRGEVVARKSDGTPYDHAKEVNESQNGLKRTIERIKHRLGYPYLQARKDPA